MKQGLQNGQYKQKIMISKEADKKKETDKQEGTNQQEETNKQERTDKQKGTDQQEEKDDGNDFDTIMAGSPEQSGYPVQMCVCPDTFRERYISCFDCGLPPYYRGKVRRKSVFRRDDRRCVSAVGIGDKNGWLGRWHCDSASGQRCGVSSMSYDGFFQSAFNVSGCIDIIGFS